MSHEELVDLIVNRDLNELVLRYSDFETEQVDPHGHGKRVPYIGWIWRDVDFANGEYVIGDCGDYVGFMENNKWGYPERPLVPDEAKQVTKIVCDAFELSSAGGNFAEITASTLAKLDELWPLLQSFPIAEEGFWIKGVQGIVSFAKTDEDADKFIESLSAAGPGFRYEKVPR